LFWSNILKFDNRQNRELFLAVLAVKVIMGVLFCAFPMRNWFIPFLDYFVNSGFHNPWDYFLSIGQIKAFPYGPAMLAFSAVPFLILYPLKAFGISSIFLATFSFTSIVLFFDYVIFCVLRKFFPDAERKIIFLYWCSPVVIYINYYHHQLDIIPVAFLMLSLLLLFNKKIIFSAILLGLGLAAKLNLLIAAPFILLYLFRSDLRKRYTIYYAFAAFAVYLACILPVAFTASFQRMVLSAPEQGWVLDMLIPFGIKGLSLLIGPFFLALLLVNFASYERVSADVLVMFIGLAFMLLVTFVFPMPGWYMWSFPFIVYAFLKYNDFPRFPIYAVTSGYLLYFIFSTGSTFFDSMALVLPKFSLISPGEMIPDILNIKPQAFDSIIFVPLVATMFYLSVLMFTLGVKSNQLYNFRRQPYCIGIGGDSASGKHTLARFIKQLFGANFVTQVDSDDYHKWERGHPMYKLYTHLNPAANDLAMQLRDASFLRYGRMVEKARYEHASGTFSDKRALKPGSFVLFVGLHPFYFPRMRKIYDFKIFLDTEEGLRREWKVKRDQQERGYSKKEVMEAMESRGQDSRHFIKPQRRFADLVIYYSSADKAVPGLKVEYEFRDEYCLDSILRYFERIKGLSLEYREDLRLGRQYLAVSGSLPAEKLKEFLRMHTNDYREILRADIDWQEGVNGFTQLLILHLFSQKVIQEL